MAPTLPTLCGSLPPEGAAAPAAWQSQFRGPGLHGEGFASALAAAELLLLPLEEGWDEGFPAWGSAPTLHTLAFGKLQ